MSEETREVFIATPRRGGPVTVDAMDSASDYARLFANKSDWTWAAGDGAGSRVAPNGARYWLFGDSIIGYPDGAGFDTERTMVSNTILVQRGAELGPATWGNGTAAVPDQGDERYWTTDILFGTSHAYVLCQRIHGGPEGFITDGAQIAEFHRSMDRLIFSRMCSTPTSLGKLEMDEIQWSCGWERDGAYVYVYGYRQAGAEEGYLTPHRTYVARVPWFALLRPKAWTFWDGHSWMPNSNYAVPILDGMLTSVRRIGGRWVFAHKPWNGYGGGVHILTSDTPTLHDATGLEILSPGGTSPGGHTYWTYNPTLHDAGMASGKTLVAISHNGEFADIFAERHLYRPEWLEVEIP